MPYLHDNVKRVDEKTALEKAKKKELAAEHSRSYSRLLGIITGGLCLGVGVGYAGNILGAWSGFSLFFPGWWTLAAMIPCLAGMLEYGLRKPLFAVGFVGSALIMVSQLGLVAQAWKLLLPVCAIYAGLRLIFKDNPFGYRRIYDTELGAAYSIPIYRSILREKKINLTSGFCGCELTALFRPIQLDLCKAKIRSGSVIHVRALFSDVLIVLPDNVFPAVQELSGAGKVNVNMPNGAEGENSTVVYISAECRKGKVEITYNNDQGKVG